MLASNVRKLRKQSNISQGKLARLANISYDTVVKIGAGKATNPTFETLAKLAGASGISIDELVGRKNK